MTTVSGPSPTPPTATLDDLATRVLTAAGARTDRRYLLGIAGPPAAGKSTLSLLLRDALDGVDPGVAEVAPMDGFHRTNADLDAAGARHRKGEPDTFDAVGFVRTLRLLATAPPGTPVGWPTFDRRVDEPTPDGIVLTDQRIAIVEGNYLLLDDRPGAPWSQVRPLLDEVWFLDADDGLLDDRLLRRHRAGGRTPEQARAKVTDSDLVNAALIRGTRERADLVLTERAGRYLVLGG